MKRFKTILLEILRSLDWFSIGTCYLLIIPTSAIHSWITSEHFDIVILTYTSVLSGLMVGVTFVVFIQRFRR